MTGEQLIPASQQDTWRALQDPDVIKQKFPKGYKAVKPYLRITPQPNK